MLSAVAEFRRLVAGLVARLPHYPIESGFLEFARPILGDGLDRLRAQGVDHVLAVPGMLFAAGHVKNDVPSVLNAYAAGTASGSTSAATSGSTPSCCARPATGSRRRSRLRRSRSRRRRRCSR